jgi:hypothetical protein
MKESTQQVQEKVRKNSLKNLFLEKLFYRIFHPKSFISGQAYVYLVYTCGKVGSQTIYSSLRFNLLESDVFHIHFLSKEWFSEIEALHSEDIVYIKNIGHLKRAIEVNRMLTSPKKKVRIVSIVRDPVSKAISQLFQTPHSFGITEEELCSLSLSDIQNLLVNDAKKQFFQPIRWFDCEFLKFTGIDVYQNVFDHKQKRQQVNSGRFEVLIVRTEDFGVEEVLLKNLSQFVNKPIRQLITSNETSSKNSGNLYKEVKAKFKLPTQLLDEIYSSKYCLHFYSQDEINSFKLRWQA